LAAAPIAAPSTPAAWAGRSYDYTSRPLRLDGEYQRDEQLQASELIDMLELLEPAAPTACS
jgi:hypothetical protein